MNKKFKLSRHALLLLCVTLPIFAVIFVADIVSKTLLEKSISLGAQKTLIPGFLDLFLVHNDGAAWGMLSDWKGANVFFIIIAFVFLAGIIWLCFVEKTKNPLFHISIGLIAAGTLGNLIDRLAFKYVRDFLYFSFWPTFPVFNVADICLTIGVALILIYMVIMLVKTYKAKKEGKVEKDS